MENISQCLTVGTDKESVTCMDSVEFMENTVSDVNLENGHENSNPIYSDDQSLLCDYTASPDMDEILVTTDQHVDIDSNNYMSTVKHEKDADINVCLNVPAAEFLCETEGKIMDENMQNHDSDIHLNVLSPHLPVKSENSNLEQVVYDHGSNIYIGIMNVPETILLPQSEGNNLDENMHVQELDISQNVTVTGVSSDLIASEKSSPVTDECISWREQDHVPATALLSASEHSEAHNLERRMEDHDLDVCENVPSGEDLLSENDGKNVDEKMRSQELEIQITIVNEVPTNQKDSDKHIPVSEVGELCNAVCENEIAAENDEVDHDILQTRCQCPVCGKKFSSAEDAQLHLKSQECCINKIISAKKVHECPICMLVFTTARSLRRHKTKKHSDKPVVDKKVECPECNQQFESSRDLKLHERVHRKKVQEFKCSECEKICNSPFNLQQHERIHAGGEFECSNCGVTFQHKKQLNAHKKSHTTEGKQPECSKCNRVFSTLDEMRGHLCKPTACLVCGKMFTKRRNLNQHMLNHSATRKFKCPKCDAVYRQKYSLTCHLKSGACETPIKNETKTKDVKPKSKPKPIPASKPCKPAKASVSNSHICSQCGKEFRTSEHLKRHMLVHSGERPYKCDQCSASYKEMTKLKIHRRTHTGERPYVCTICNAAFNVSGTLRKHVKTHIGDYAFGCSLCNAKFIDRAALARHTRVHTGEKPYKCDLCPSAHSTASALKIHIRTHTGERPYVCSKCGNGYIAYSCLKDHLLRNHGMTLKIDKL